MCKYISCHWLKDKVLFANQNRRNGNSNIVMGMIYNYKVPERKQYPDAIFTQAIKFVARIQLARLLRLYRFAEPIHNNIY